MEADKIKVIIEDMRRNPGKYSQEQKDTVFKGMQQEAQRLSQAEKAPPVNAEQGLSPEQSIRALRQFMESNYQNEWQRQKSWDIERQNFGKAIKDMRTLGVPRERLQPYILQFLEKEAEMNNRAVQIPEEIQKKQLKWNEEMY